MNEALWSPIRGEYLTKPKSDRSWEDVIGTSARVVGAGPWYVVIVDPNQEHDIVEKIKREGFDAYSPRIWRRIQWRGRWIDTQRPMFVSYGFVRFERGEWGWRAIESIRGVWQFLRLGEEVAGLSETAIAAVKAKEAELEEMHMARIHGKTVKHNLQPGQTIAMPVGKWSEIMARVDKVDEKGRVEVLMDMLGATKRVKLSAVEAMRARVDGG